MKSSENIILLCILVQSQISWLFWAVGFGFILFEEHALNILVVSWWTPALFQIVAKETSFLELAPEIISQHVDEANVCQEQIQWMVLFIKLHNVSHLILVEI